MTGQVFPPSAASCSPPLPSANGGLIRELSSACVDAEIAHIARSWSLSEIERRVGAFKPAQSPVDARKKSFHALRSGSKLQAGHAQRIQAHFPRSHVLYWWETPIALALCDPKLGSDRLLAWLKAIPPGKVRKQVWDFYCDLEGGWHVGRLLPWSPNLIQRLGSCGSVSAFGALICRYRLEQLTGNIVFGSNAYIALWEMLPSVLRRSRSLRVCTHSLCLALDGFLSVEPFSTLRMTETLWGSMANARARSISACESIWRSESRIPQEIMESRRQTAVLLGFSI